jgi:hypothetical protein
MEFIQNAGWSSFKIKRLVVVEIFARLRLSIKALLREDGRARQAAIFVVKVKKSHKKWGTWYACILTQLCSGGESPNGGGEVASDDMHLTPECYRK